MNENFCRHLRTKKMYIDVTPAEALADKIGVEASPCHFWCNLTQTEVGMDDHPVHRDSCNASRSCFEE